MLLIGWFVFRYDGVFVAAVGELGGRVVIFDVNFGPFPGRFGASGCDALGVGRNRFGIVVVLAVVLAMLLTMAFQVVSRLGGFPVGFCLCGFDRGLRVGGGYRLGSRHRSGIWHFRQQRGGRARCDHRMSILVMIMILLGVAASGLGSACPRSADRIRILKLGKNKRENRQVGGYNAEKNGKLRW